MAGYPEAMRRFWDFFDGAAMVFDPFKPPVYGRRTALEALDGDRARLITDMRTALEVEAPKYQGRQLSSAR